VSEIGKEVQSLLTCLADRAALAAPQSIDEVRLMTEKTNTELFTEFGNVMPPIKSVEDFAVGAGSRTCSVRVYTPSRIATRAAVIRIHGGGWILGSVNWPAFETLSRRIAEGVGCVVVDVDYRLAPEFPYPAGLEECYSALVWVADNAARLKIDPARIILHGDSAGGVLAAGLSLLTSARQGPAVAGQLLEVPCPDHAAFETYPSAVEFATGFGLEVSDLVAGREIYFRDPAQSREPFASPCLGTDFSGYPRTHVMTAEYDPVRDVGERFVSVLQQAGVEASGSRGEGHIHVSPFLLDPYWIGAKEWGLERLRVLREMTS
jgi:acetyl esterase